MAARRSIDPADADTTASLRLSLPANVFDDLYAINPLAAREGAAAAGTTNTTEPNRTRPVAGSSLTPEPSTDRDDAQPSVNQTDPRSSIRKSRAGPGAYGASSALPLAHDHGDRPESTYSSTSSRASNVFGDEHAASFSGPSHPYGMYPQGVPRSASVTTASTSSNRPAHPYGIYPQNSFADADEDVAAMAATTATAIPVGFPGHLHGFHRQIGPDGEEQDIIGPDGHTEQLPPYSRYPDEGVKRPIPDDATTTVVAAALPATGPVSPLTMTAPTIPLPVSPLASPITESPVSSTRNSHISHRDTLPLSSGALVPGDTPSESGMSEKTWGEKSWKEKRKTKVLWGRIPLWVLLLTIGMIAILAVVIGAVIGSFVAKQRAGLNPADPSSPQVVTTTATASMFDASVIAVPPTGLPPLPTGVFRLPLGTPEEQQKGCLTNNSQFEAWTCETSGPPMNLNIIPPGQIPGMQFGAAQLQSSDRIDGTIYGTQPPIMSPQKLVLVADLDDPGRGPAYHFSTHYDKIVVLQSWALPGGVRNGPNKRDFFPNAGFGNGGFRRHNRVEIGDSPWMCIWNNTFIEGFIYANMSTGFALNAASRSGGGGGPPGPSATATPTSTSSGSSSATGAPSSTSGGPGSAPTQNFTPSYPRVVKIEERRLPKPNLAPYCQQLHVFEDGSVHPAQDKNGKYILVTISESDPPLADFSSRTQSSTSSAPMIKARHEATARRHHSASRSVRWNTNYHGVAKRDDPPGSCHCQWVSQ